MTIWHISELPSLMVRSCAYAVIRGLDNHIINEEWSDYWNQRLNSLEQQYASLDYHTDPRLEGYHILHDRAGVKRRKNIPSAENLIRMLRKHGTLPTINPVVDIYNLFSVENRLCIAAHDLSHIEGGITVKFPMGTERYIPMGQNEPVPLDEHEYYYCDQADDVLCRLELHQCNKTIVTAETRDLLLIIEGHDDTPDSLLGETARELVNTIVRYCGGVGCCYKAEIEI